jgi:hypothetical protein
MLKLLVPMVWSCLAFVAASCAPAWSQGATGATERVYTGPVELAFVGRELLLATPGGIEITADPNAKQPVFQALLDVELTSPPLISTYGSLFGAVTAAGEFVAWDRLTGKAVWRVPCTVDPPEAQVTNGRPMVQMGPNKELFVGDGRSKLIRLQAGQLMPRSVDYPGPGYSDALRIDADGGLTVLPSQWQWNAKSGGWTSGAELDFVRADGRNRIAVADKGDLIVVSRHERPSLLHLDAKRVVELGYHDVMDVALDPAGTWALVSTAGAKGDTGYGPGETNEEPLLGQLRVFDARTGAPGAWLPHADAPLGPNESASRRTLGLGLRVAALGEGRFATIDFVDDMGAPSLFLRLRGADLIATAERKLTGGEWPVFLEAGGESLAVIYLEQAIEVHDLSADSLASYHTLPIAPPEVLPGHPAAARTVFALSQDGTVLAMGGRGGSLALIDARTGEPFGVANVVLPKGLQRPMSAHFTTAGELVVLSEDKDAEGLSELHEWTLDSALQEWSAPVARQGPGEFAVRLAAGGTPRVELRRGLPGNVDVYFGALAAGQLQGHLVLRYPIGPEPIDALAISNVGDIAWARNGEIFVVQAEQDER